MSEHPESWSDTYSVDELLDMIRSHRHAMQPGQLRESVDKISSTISTLKAQRDDLLAAAEGIEAWWRLPNIARTVDTIEPPMRAIIEATANAEEDKP